MLNRNQSILNNLVYIRIYFPTKKGNIVSMFNFNIASMLTFNIAAMLFFNIKLQYCFSTLLRYWKTITKLLFI